MPATSVYALPYPSPDDQAGKANEQIRALAEGTEAMLEGLLSDTGVQANPSLSMGSGWSLIEAQFRVVGGTEMELFVFLERTGSQLVATSAGNILGDPVFCTLTDPTQRPAFSAYGSFVASLTSGQWQLDAGTGVLAFVDMHALSSIDTSHTARIHAVYPLPA